MAYQEIVSSLEETLSYVDKQFIYLFIYLLLGYRNN